MVQVYCQSRFWDGLIHVGYGKHNDNTQESDKMNNTEILIERLLATDVGGKEFYEILDMSVRNEDFFIDLVMLAIDTFGRIPMNIVLSGQFGVAFNEWSKNGILHKLVVNGGLRYGDIIESSLSDNEIRGREFVFLDDTFYKGRTRDKVREYVESRGGTLTDTFVVFDAGLSDDNSVHSIYRKEANE